MSGHSKWATIKHKKAANDKARGKLFAKVLRQVEVAAREGGGDPDMNPTLRTMFQKARDASIPIDTIERAVKRGTGELDGVTYEQITYEGYAPGGVAVMVEVLTDNRNRTGAEIRNLFLKATPLVEPVSLDEAYLDLSAGVRRIDRPPAALLARLAKAIETTVGVTVSVGLSYNKSLAKLASEREKPRGFSIIGRNEAKRFLASLPVTTIHGIGAATALALAEGGADVLISSRTADQLEAVATRIGQLGRRALAVPADLDEIQGPARQVESSTGDACDVEQVSIETAQSNLDCSVLTALDGKTIILGVIDLSDPAVETPEVVAGRVRPLARPAPYV